MLVGVILPAGSTLPDRTLGEGPDQNQPPGPPGWGLDMRLTTSPCKRDSVMETPTRTLQPFGYQKPSEPSQARMTSGSGSQQEVVAVRLGASPEH